MRPVGQSRVAGYPHRLGHDVTDGLPHTERRDEYATKTDTRRADRGAIVGAGQNRVNRPLDEAPQAGSAGLHSTGQSPTTGWPGPTPPARLQPVSIRSYRDICGTALVLDLAGPGTQAREEPATLRVGQLLHCPC